MGTTGAICLSLVLFVGGISISSSCSIVDVSKCYRLLLTQSSVYTYCNTIPRARRCMSDLSRSNKCLDYFQKLIEMAVVTLDDIGDSPRCRRYGSRRYVVPEQLTDRRDQNNRRQQVGEERKDRYEVTRRRVVVTPEQNPSYESERRRVRVDDGRRSRTDDRPQPIRRRNNDVRPQPIRRQDNENRRQRGNDDRRSYYDYRRRQNESLEDENRRRYYEARRGQNYDRRTKEQMFDRRTVDRYEKTTRRPAVGKQLTW